MASDDDIRRALEQRLLLHRRRFLGLAAAGAGALVLGACSTSGDQEAEPAPEAGDDGDPTTTTTIAPDEVPPAEGIDGDPFLLGVASGDPDPTSVVLWTKLATDLTDPTGLGGLGEVDHAVRWEVATDEGFDDVVAAGIEPAPAELGHSVHVTVDGLDADAWYWYRFRIGDRTSPVARTRTAPAEGAAVDELRLAFASCQLRTAGHWTAYDHLVADEPDLVAFLGDYVYEYPGGTGDLAIPLDDEPRTLAEYRILYAAYQRDPKLQAAHAVAPWVITWDDHEVENNYAADVPEDDADAADFDERRRAAYQAFWEAHPLRADPPADDGSLQVYRSLAWGALADLFVLDGRQYRTDQPCGGGVAIDATECEDLDTPASTMLGTEQEAWLTDGLEASEATWKVLAQQTVVKALVLGNIVLNVDQWDGYPSARRRLLEGIADAGIDNVVVLTGDIHAGGAADLRVPDAGSDGDIVAHELVAPGISSPGLGALADAVAGAGLDLAYANFSDNGYVRCTITPERWRTEFVVVDTIGADTSPASVAGTVDLQAGTPGLTTVS